MARKLQFVLITHSWHCGRFATFSPKVLRVSSFATVVKQDQEKWPFGSLLLG